MADVFRTHQGDFLTRWNRVLSREQRKALKDIQNCRTAALGGHLHQCDRCGHRVLLYNSCRNRHCPQCQAKARARWLEQREAELLPVPYFHVVFTLPPLIGYLALQNPRTIYNILFRAASQTLLETAAETRLLGASIGFLAVLHTWGQNLQLHPHLHCVVPGGGISPDGSRWIACRKDSFFLPVRLLSHRFRKKFLSQLRHAFLRGALHFHGELRSLAGPAAFELLCDEAAHIDWVVYSKAPFGGPQRVLKYLARYTHRVAISNHRLRALENGRVNFEWKDYAHRGQRKLMTLDAAEFIRRFLLHVLPSGLVRIRQFGFLANRVRAEKLTLCRGLLDFRQLAAPANSEDQPHPNTQQLQCCPICKFGRLVVIEILAPQPPIEDTS